MGGPARLHFNKDKRIAIISDDVDLRREFLAAQASSKRHAEIEGDDSITFVVRQIIERRSLSALT